MMVRVPTTGRYVVVFCQVVTQARTGGAGNALGHMQLCTHARRRHVCITIACAHSNPAHLFWHLSHARLCQVALVAGDGNEDGVAAVLPQLRKPHVAHGFERHLRACSMVGVYAWQCVYVHGTCVCTGVVCLGV